MSIHSIRHTFLKHPHEIRHLLIHSHGSVAILSKIILGLQTRIATDAEHAIRQKAEMLMQEWVGEGFKEEDRPVFDSLEQTVALVTAMGYRIVYDPQKIDMRSRNLTGAVPLAQWTGRKGKNGADYEYAFDGTSIIGQPTLPPNHGLNMRRAKSAEFISVMQQALKLRDALGATVTFILAE